MASFPRSRFNEHKRQSQLMRVAHLILLWSFTAAFLAHADRFDLDLSGAWQYQNVAQIAYPPPAAWLPTTVPGYLSTTNYEHAWFRKTFDLPAVPAGNRVRLRFGGVKFASQVWVNGTPVGGYLNGYEPFEFDVTAAARSGANELLVALTDWTATFSYHVDFSNLAPYENPRDHAMNALLAPIGGRYDLYGVWQPVHVLSVPAVATADVFVMPSVRQKQLTARLTLRNDTAAPQTVVVRNQVLDGDTAVLDFPQQSLTLAASASQEVEVAAPWANPHLWSHLDPYLYQLRTTLDNAGAADAVTNRFGFRELWTEGSNYVFNGTPIHLLATATWPTASFLSSTQIQTIFAEVKAAHCVAMRLHTQPWDELFYKVADETGILLIEENAVWCDAYSYRLADPVFWTNYLQHVTAAIRRDCNHPSIVQWSLENELLSVGGALAWTGTVQQLALLGARVKALDPTRPITYESDLDPNGAADVLGLHYPHEYPDFALWPNTAYWMDTPIARDWMPGGTWQWHGDKPLYIGEFLYIPGNSADGFSILFGDDAYRDTATKRILAKCWTWQMQIEAYRSYGVSGIAPWTMFEDPAVPAGTLDLNPTQNQLYQAQQAAYQPNAVFVQPYNPRFFVGDTPSRTLSIYNDTLQPGNFVLKWRTADGAPWNTRPFNLAPAAKRVETVSVPTPATPGAFPFQIELDNGTTPVFTNQQNYSACARPTLRLPAGVRLGVYDPPGASRTLLTRLGVPFDLVTNLITNSYGPWNVLLIGQGALTNDSSFQVGTNLPATQWEQFAGRGGWILVMEQDVYPRWMPLGVNIEGVGANFAFPNPNHPLAQGLAAEDLRWWAGDHLVAAKAIRVPARGNFRVPIQIGSSQGLEYAGVLELPIGQGGLLCSQLLLNEKFDAEPMAAAMWQRLFDYVAPAAPHPASVVSGLVTETNSTVAAELAALGLVSEARLGQLTNLDARTCPLLIVGGGAAAWTDASNHLDRLAAFVQAGGRLLLHQPPDGFLNAAATSLLSQVTWANGPVGQVLRRDGTNLVAHFANHDLHCLSQPGNWNQPEVLSTNLARRTYQKRFSLSAYAMLHAETMAIHSSGGAVAGGWELWENGYVGQNLVFPASGSYLFSITARGTPVAGVYPHMSLNLDGQVQDSIFLRDNTWQAYTLSADVTAGSHLFTISFDNDAYQPPEDRNLFLGQILYGLDPGTNGVNVLTKPGIVAQAPLGRGLVVVDEIAWDTETMEQVKTGRLAGSLLTGLGAILAAHPSLRILGTEMTNVDIAAYSTNGGTANLNSNGRIELPVNFTSTGNYQFDIQASGTPAIGVWPLVQLRLDGVIRQTFSVTNTALGHYLVRLPVTAGRHVVALAFINDYYAPPQDRNAAVAQLLITPEPPPRFLSLNLDATNGLATLTWEAVVGRTYQIDALARLGALEIGTARVTNLTGTAQSWTDDGTVTGAPPGSPAAPSRFYWLEALTP